MASPMAPAQADGPTAEEAAKPVSMEAVGTIAPGLPAPSVLAGAVPMEAETFAETMLREPVPPARGDALHPTAVGDEPRIEEVTSEAVQGSLRASAVMAREEGPTRLLSEVAARPVMDDDARMKVPVTEAAMRSPVHVAATRMARGSRSARAGEKLHSSAVG